MISQTQTESVMDKFNAPTDLVGTKSWATATPASPLPTLLLLIYQP